MEMKFYFVIAFLVTGIANGKELANITKINKSFGINVGSKVSKTQPCGPSFTEKSHNPQGEESLGYVIYNCKPKSSSSPFRQIRVSIRDSIVTYIGADGVTDKNGEFTDSVANNIASLEANYPELKKAKKSQDDGFTTYNWQSNGVFYDLLVIEKQKSASFASFTEEGCHTSFFINYDHTLPSPTRALYADLCK